MSNARQRGSYAKFICLNCRKRKIKCILPENAQAPDGEGNNSGTSPCQRCAIKGLECILDHTILGRPSKRHKPLDGGLSMSVHTNCTSGQHGTEVNPDRDLDSVSDEGLDVVDEYLMVKPKAKDDVSPRSEDHRRLAPADKFRAMTSVPYLLSMLLLRDRNFARAVQRSRDKSGKTVFGLLDRPLVEQLGQSLIWHRLHYPDIPRLSGLHERLLTNESGSEDISGALLLTLLCALALDVAGSQVSVKENTRADLEALIFTYAQQLLFTLPPDRYCILALELILEYRPLVFATDRITAAQSVRGRLTPPLAREVASNVGLASAPARLRRQLGDNGEIVEQTLHECLQWYRLCFTDIFSVASSESREHIMQRLSGENVNEIVSLLQDLLGNSRVPHDLHFAVHSLLCQARQLQSLLAIKANWRNLSALERILEGHKEACEAQKASLGSSQLASEIGHDYAVAISQLIDAQLHGSHCFVSGVGLFFCIMAGNTKAQAATAHGDTEDVVDAEQAMQVSDNIIERFAEPTRDQYAGDPYTAFLVKHGKSRTDDLELALAKFLAAADGLEIQGIPYLPPTRRVVCGILAICKDIMEGNAARMKGWGGLHDKVHMQMLLIRSCAETLERLGVVKGETSNQAVMRGCLWASTARVLRSFCGMLAKWQKWCALGKAAPSPDMLVDSTSAVPAEADRLDDFFPEDFFFDWDLWLQQNDEWTFV
ncbi:hypothetical protein HII31_10342 [Pseudocercospora fuligena]|uniref:Zn(2)-C6 fungal-type domain-containing protein n=1 Tax=Pseudocercospora fuligena TaxID=685502 RepID=A0A8H6VDG4_9PEZI|nr:hypothetical protein HII31_10342 [Pseudocercospora fuligena]